MTARPLLPGKLPPDLLAGLLAEGPPLPPEVRLGPAPGEDACALDLPPGTLVVATDPITLTGSEVGAHSVVINANDVAVMGVRPRWFLACVLLPAGTEESEVRALFRGLRQALAELPAALVGGHTEVTEAVRRPVVVGQMLGLAETGAVVTTGGLRPGDRVLQVGPAPVEGGAVLALEAGPALAALPAAVVAAARDGLREPGISVVEAALAAARLGATALHDPTESGLSAGLYELALASGLALEVDPQAALWFEPARRVCETLGADPWGVLASGTLLAGLPPDQVPAALDHFGKGARVLAVAREGAGVTLSDGTALPRFERDEVARLLAADP